MITRCLTQYPWAVPNAHSRGGWGRAADFTTSSGETLCQVHLGTSESSRGYTEVSKNQKCSSSVDCLYCFKYKYFDGSRVSTAKIMQLQHCDTPNNNIFLETLEQRFSFEEMHELVTTCLPMNVIAIADYSVIRFLCMNLFVWYSRIDPKLLKWIKARFRTRRRWLFDKPFFQKPATVRLKNVIRSLPRHPPAKPLETFAMVCNSTQCLFHSVISISSYAQSKILLLLSMVL